MKKIISIMLTVLLVMQFGSHRVAKAEEQAENSAQAACVLELNTNTVLYSKLAHKKLPMASTTKVMTAILAIEYGDLDTVITTADEAYGVEGSSIYLRLNEKMSLRDLIYGLMLRSGNDAAVAIAVHISGSVDEFAKLMNEKAQSLGAVNTHFVTPNGLPAAGHYTTAYDLALICSYAMKNATFREIVGTRYHNATTGDVARTMMNKNKLLNDYEGALGIKTGYTKEAGKCLTFSAKRDGMTVVGVVLNCPNMFEDSMNLMNYCFENYELYNIVHAGTVVIRTFIPGADKPAVLVTAQDICVPVKKSDGIKLTTKIECGELKAPIKKGAKAGRLYIYADASLPIAGSELVLQDDVIPYGFAHYWKLVIERFAA